MPYTLEVHHIFVTQGDSSLILVRDEANGNIVKSVLIDGGLATASGYVDAYVRNQNVANLDVIIASHYDKDHYYGLTELFTDISSVLCDYATIYDRGEVGSVDSFGNVSGRKNDFARYVTEADRINTRIRATEKVVATRVLNIPPGWEGANWLVDKRIFDLNAGNTTMTCIVANKWVDKPNNFIYVEGPQAIDDNPFSLGFLITHNNFRYFTAGDLTIAQEEQAGKYLNQAKTNKDAGHVCAVKMSHHGSDKSSSAAYFAQIRPRAAFISSGLNNGYGHPMIKALENIENSPMRQHYYLSTCGAATPSSILLGCDQNLNQITTNSMARVAGDRHLAPPVAHRGDVVLRVTDVQSRANPHQFSVTYYEEDNNANLTINHTC
jgi:beta-lactamase superfamily II metal-dependent hydrolase